MKKRRIVEYLEGTPDAIYDTNTERTFRWDDGNAICFGYFPTNIDGDYEFLVGKRAHLQLAMDAANKLIGKASSKVSDDYKAWIRTQCYEKSYGIGRLWKLGEGRYAIVFWYLPTADLTKGIVGKLGIDPNKTIIVTEDFQNKLMDNMTLAQYIENCIGEDDGHEEIESKLKIDSKVADVIRSYNKPEETFASQKEKKGWKTMAQRNAMLYQEGKERINEYFEGDPDTIEEYDDNSDRFIRDLHYDSSNAISFGYFQTSLDGGKEFVYDDKLSHHDIASNIADKIIGKALGSDRMNANIVFRLRNAVYSQGAYKGRIFLDARVVTTWHVVSSEQLSEIINNLGGIDKYGDFTYVFPDRSNKDGNLTVSEYIQSNYTMTSRAEEMLMGKDIKDSFLRYPFDAWVIDYIRDCNSPSSKLANKTSKLGNMTIAQYNSLIHQEEKEPKKTIKENINNMKDNNKYQEEFSNYINIMNEALQKSDFKAYEYAKDMLEEAIEDSKHEKELMNELNTTNFGVLNHIFENELPTLIKTNKKGVRDVIKTIREDKNLRSQFSFYNVIKEQYNGSHAEKITPETALEKLVKIVSEEIDQKSVKKSNKKLRDVMVENHITPSDFVDEESRKLYESGDVILTAKRTSNNMLTLAESYNEVCNWMDKHKDDKKANGKDVDAIIREFEEKLKTNLNESEMSFVQEITDFRSPIAEKRKEKLFNKFKNECINKINDMLKEDADNSELKNLSEQINEMKFDKNNIVKDIAKLLEIRDILMDD